MEQNSPPPPAGSGQSNHGLSIAGFVISIIALMVSFIPCVGVFSLIPGIIGIVLSGLSLVQLSKINAPRQLAIAGLICSLVACSISVIQIVFLKKASSKMYEHYEYFQQNGGMDSLNHEILEIQTDIDSLKNEFENGGMDSIHRSFEKLEVFTDSLKAKYNR